MKNEIIKVGKSICPEFVIDEGNKHAYSMIYFWLAGIKTEEMDPLRGLAFFGEFGTGKDVAMRITMRIAADGVIIKNFNRIKRGAVILSASDIRDSISIGQSVKGQNEDALTYYNERPLSISDLGKEEKKLMVYGNEMNVMERILCRRYDYWQRRMQDNDYSNLTFTHITTNLSGEGIKEQYGERVHDRFKEMFNFVTFYGKSRRK